MTEREKMLLGLPYYASDPELIAARVEARRLTRQLSAVDPADAVARMVILNSLLGEVGAGASVEPPFNCDYGKQITLGERVFINMSCVFLDAASITLGDDVQLGPAVQLLTSDHPRNAQERADRLESARPIAIGKRVWLEGGASVLPGVEIGDDTLVGAGSVVTRSLSAGIRAAGNPCRELRPR